MSAIEDVRKYYDDNTARFERFGQGGGTIHRAVWGPNVESRAEAFRYIDRLILDELGPLAARVPDTLHVLDLGCGVGSSLLFLASRANIRGTGATLSRLQAERARERSRCAGLAERVEFIVANYLELPSSVAPAELAFSIEAFIHGPDPAAYFHAAARYLAPGGLLVVCDDFLTADAGSHLPERSRRFLREVRSGWLANTLVTTSEADALARSAGLLPVKNLDLTPYLELGRPRDRALSLLVEVGRYLPLRGSAWRSFLGGNALQQALSRRLLEYRFLVWQRIESDGVPSSERERRSR